MTKKIIKFIIQAMGISILLFLILENKESKLTIEEIVYIGLAIALIKVRL